MTLEAIPLSGAMGAEVRGADLREVDDDTFAEIHNILLDHGMIFFRDQDITPAQQLALAKRWGEKNSPRVAHPIVDQLPPLFGSLVRLPDPPQSGSVDAVKVIRPGFGASLRMVISPSDHNAAIFHMPGGQSGDPRADNYRKGHSAWLKGRPTSMRSGPAVRVIRLKPAG